MLNSRFAVLEMLLGKQLNQPAEINKTQLYGFFQTLSLRFQKIIITDLIDKLEYFMQQKKSKANQFVNSVTNFTQMRFAPKKILDDKQRAKGAQLVEKIKNVFPWGSALASSESLESAGHSNMVISKVSEEAMTHQALPEHKQHQLRFCAKLTMEHIIIGNRNQLDVVSIGLASRSYLDSEFLWSLTIDCPIDLLATDIRKSLIVLGNKTEKKLWIFRFAPKKMTERAYLLEQIKLLSPPQEIYFLKDLMIVIYAEKIELFTINNQYEVMRKYSENFNLLTDKQLKFFKTPEPLENFINIFFTEEFENKNIFSLWLLEIEITANNLKMKPLQKIYDIKTSLKKKLVLKSFSKETFLMNLGTEILAFKKGYMIDSVSISITANNSILKYIGDERLVHVSDKRIQLYEFTLNTTTKPYRIMISPLDSISMRTPIDSKFFKVIEVFNKNIVIIFQIKSRLNRKIKGQINYWLALTQPITLKQKIDMLFPTRKFLSMAQEDLQEHCDMARKMGLSNKQIFTELWNRSMKRQADFGLLISTRDYDCIREEVVKLLKKNSLSFSEIYKLERSSFSMLKEDVYGTNCTQSIFFGYISSSFLKRKLEYFRDTCIMERKSKQTEILMVSIKKFNEIKQLNIETTLIDLMKDLCYENKPVQNQIRLFLNMFKFTLRMVYKDLLAKIICVLEEKFIILLEKIPEILPYDLSEEEKKRAINHIQGFYEGIYGLLRDEDEHLSFDRIVTVDNKEIISAAIKDLWFKRNFLSNHCFIVENNEKIQENFKWISSESIFYFVIESIVNSGIKNADRKKLFHLLQSTYQSRLSHLQGRINLRYMIFSYLDMKKILPEDDSGCNLTLKSFMSLDDEKLFAYLFEIERERKGLLLSEIKPIYEESSEDGLKIFNESLLDYFKKPVSQLSDIKYLLNRINNEKKQFHTGHQDMYKILVEAMTYKMMIGTQNDIPLSEIIIYIQNVPLEKNNEMFSKLTVIHEIDENMELLSNAKINMSVKQIIQNPQLVMTRLIEYLIVKEGLNSESPKLFEITYNILANLQFLHHAFYKPDQETFYIFFIFLTKICENASMISFGKQLLNDEFLSKQFSYDSTAAESLVIYMYKLKMSSKPAFDENQYYLKKLLTLLPEENEIREFIICEYEFAKLLTSESYKVQYPLGSRHNTPGLSELEVILYNLSAEKILSLDVEKVFELMKRLQELNEKIYQNISALEDEDKSMIYSSLVRAANGPTVTKKQVYQVIILCLLSMRKIQETVPYIDKFLEEDPQQSDIVYPFVFLAQIGGELNHESRGYFFKICAFNFLKPVNLFAIIKRFLLDPLNSKQKSQFLKNEVQKGQATQKGLNIDNKLLNQNLIKIAIGDGLQHKLFNNFHRSFIHLINSRAQFQEIGYSFIFIILINSPQVLAKYMLCSKRHLKIKSFRLILTYITKEKSFDNLNALEFGYRFFLMVMFMLKEQAPLQVICDKYFSTPLNEELPDTIQCSPIPEFEYFARLQHSADAFKRQRQLQAKALENERGSSVDRQRQELKKHRQKLLNPDLIGEQEPIQYSEVSSDSEQQSPKEKFGVTPKKKNFDAQNEMKKVIEAGKRKKSWQVNQDDIDVFTKQKKGESQQNSEMNEAEEHYEHFQNPQDIVNNKVSEEYVIRVNPKDSFEEDKIEVHEIKQVKTEEKESQKGKLEIMPDKNLKVKQIIRQSSLSVAGDDQENVEEGFQGNLSEKISIGDFVDKHSSDFSGQAKAKQGLKHGSLQKNSLSLDKNEEKSPATPTKKTKKIEIQESYPWFEGLPSVEETGKQIYRGNLIEIEKTKKRIFKIKLLTKFEKHPEFTKYMFNVIQYIFKESTASSLNGVIHLIEFIIDNFKLPIDKKNLQIWTRAQNLQQKYQLDIPIRELLPINPVFEQKMTPEHIFSHIIQNIVDKLDEINVFKMSKLVSLAFQMKEFQDEIIFRYFKKLTKSQEKIGESLYQEEKIAALIEKLPTEFINQKFDEIMETTHEDKRNMITAQLAQKMKKKAKRNEKVQFFTRLSARDPSYANTLANIMRV